MLSDTVLYVACAIGQPADPARFTYGIKLKGYGLTATQAKRAVPNRRTGEQLVVYSIRVSNAEQVTDVVTCIRDLPDVMIALGCDDVLALDPRTVQAQLHARYAPPRQPAHKYGGWDPRWTDERDAIVARYRTLIESAWSRYA